MKTNDKVELVQKEDKIIITKPKKRHLTLEERFKMFETLSDDEKGSIESYDWGKDLEKEIFD